MQPLEGLDAYFRQVPTLYDGTVWKQCTNQTLLDAKLIERIDGFSPSGNEYVTKVAFDSVKVIVNAAIEDWPAAIGSVYNVIQDIYHIISGSRSVSERSSSVSLEERITEIENFLSQNYNYIPPN